jgi:8-amino-7-oxononanoate synthase
MPKGVMVSHKNLLHNEKLIASAFRHTTETIGVGWLPLFHDMGLIGHVLQPIYVGFPSVIMPPEAFIQKPLRWLQAISRYKATSSGGPNFAYELCASKIKPQERENLDLSCWDVAFNGAEPVRAATLEKFANTFADYGFKREAFYPCYGMAETTLFVSGGIKSQSPVIEAVDKLALLENNAVTINSQHPNAQLLVGCGHAWLSETIVIVNPESLTECRDGEIGEIWVSSDSVAQGYWNRPEQTEETFKAYLADTQVGPFLRTGDLGFLLAGELFITGRIKDLIIVQGRNHYPQDIEATVQQSNSALRKDYGAAFSIEIAGQERLVVVQEVERSYLRKLDYPVVIQQIISSVAEEHQLDVYAVALLKTASIPKTSSGKIQRIACRTAFLAGTLDVIGDWSKNPEHKNGFKQLKSDINCLLKQVKTYQIVEELSEGDQNKILSDTQGAIEKWLTKKIAVILQIAPEKIDIKQDLASYGLSSLAAISLSGELEQWLGKTVSPTLVYEYHSIHAVARYLAPNGLSSEKIVNTSLVNSVDLANFEQDPAYQKIKHQIKQLETLGLQNPYFKINQGVAKNITQIGEKELINYSSYNYLGMSGEPKVGQAAKEAIDDYGTSVSASRVVSGEKLLHQELEQEIANLVGAEDALVYVGGYSTNVTTISHLFGKNDLIVCDVLSHNSIIQGCINSGASLFSFSHNDWQALEHILQEKRCQYEKALIVIEGVYSMDGDIPNLPKFIELRKRYRTALMIDEAHSIGVLGKSGCGIGEYFGVNPSDIDLWMGTLSKSFASCGGYIAGKKAIIEYLKYTAPGFVYSVGISPPNAASALASIRLLKSEPERVKRLHQNSNLFLNLAKEHGLNTGLSKDSAVIPIIVGNSLKCIQLSQSLFHRGINVQPLIYPAVADNTARLRFFMSCTHTEKQVHFTVEAVVDELKKFTNS